ncbi:MAG: thiamine pyrophosphate-dependent enzyme [Chloroflexota bacterium]
MSRGSKAREKVCGWPELWRPIPGAVPFCPGCQEPVVGRVVCEVVHELGIEGSTVAVVGVGCSGFMGMTLDVDCVIAAHGRALDVATGLKRTHPDTIVFTVQGDGDCLSIGAEALIAAMGRGESVTVVMLNNANYGTTGGQMAPTTLVGQVTTTTPEGRHPAKEGYPVHGAELVASFKGVSYSARSALFKPTQYQQTKRYIRSAFEKQRAGMGLSFVEVLSACPVDWRLTPVESLMWIEREMVKEFPLGEFKNVDTRGVVE